MIGIFLMLLAGVASASELEVISGPGHAGALEWEHAELRYWPDEPGQFGHWNAHLYNLTTAAGALGSVHLKCSLGRLQPTGSWCESGTVRWVEGPLLAQIESSFQLTGGEQGIEIVLTDGPVYGQLVYASETGQLTVALEFDALPLAAVSDDVLERVNFQELGGHLAGNLEYVDGRVSGTLRLHEVGFDSLDGETAGLDINAELSYLFQPGPDRTDFELTVVQSDGEILFGQVYLPPPQGSLTLQLSGHRGSDGLLVLENLELDDPGAITAQARLVLRQEEDGWKLASFRSDVLQMEFPLAWERWLEGPMAAAGLAEIATTGGFSAEVAYGSDELHAEVRLEDFHFDDPQGRLGFAAANATVIVDDNSRLLTGGWDSFSLFGLPFGPSSLQLAGNKQSIGLVEPVHMPLLDGAVVIERLLWDHAELDDRELQLDARIEPLSLAELTQLLGFPQFGGTLSGNFPGIRYADQVLSFTGGIDVRAFSGRIELSDLAIERPFGTLPALIGEVEFHRLDLAEATEVFNFGHMEGQVSGWMHGLRLLDWRPVAMDARLFTHADVPRRRISQRAVENLSNLGGAGGALISGTVLRVFDDFPYRRAGLACRLSNNICYIDGVARHDSGGFYIIQGRSLPRLDIIGHRRLVDWPQLMMQLEAMMDE